jgi:DNA-binding transcriptional MocR family regulator
MPDKKLEEKLDEKHPDWIAIAPGMYVQEHLYQMRQYYSKRREASKKYMESIAPQEKKENRPETKPPSE